MGEMNKSVETLKRAQTAFQSALEVYQADTSSKDNRDATQDSLNEATKLIKELSPGTNT
jgi:hypothetical protein